MVATVVLTLLETSCYQCRDHSDELSAISSVTTTDTCSFALHKMTE